MALRPLAACWEMVVILTWDEAMVIGWDKMGTSVRGNIPCNQGWALDALIPDGPVKWHSLDLTHQKKLAGQASQTKVAGRSAVGTK